MPKSFIDRIFAIMSTEIESGRHILLIGAFAVNYYGYSRSTMDVDFMMAAGDVSSIRSILADNGYTNISEQENVVFFESPKTSLRIDMVKVDQQTMDKLWGNAHIVEYHGHRIALPALEDLIAMKLFAAQHGPTARMAKDLPDIVQLVRINEVDVEKVLQPLCQKFASADFCRHVLRAIEEGGHS